MLVPLRASIGCILPCLIQAHFLEHKNEDAYYCNRDCELDGSPHVSLHPGA